MSASVILRTATAADASAIHRLIVDNLEVGHLLPRSPEDVQRHVTRFVVATVAPVAAATNDGAIVGCAELAPLSGRVAEVRSLVVSETCRGQGIGPRLVREVASTATAAGFWTLSAFAHDPSHFVRMGFTIVPHTWVPEKISHDCTSCALFRRCGQHALTLALRPGVTIGPELPAAVIHGTRPAATRRLALRPIAAQEEAPRVLGNEAVPA